MGFEGRKCKSSNYSPLYQDFFWYSGCFALLYVSQFTNFCERPSGISTAIMSNLVGNVGQIILTTLSLPIWKYPLILVFFKYSPQCFSFYAFQCRSYTYSVKFNPQYILFVCFWCSGKGILKLHFPNPSI